MKTPRKMIISILSSGYASTGLKDVHTKQWTLLPQTDILMW